MGVTSLFQYLDKLSLNYYRTYEEVGIYASAMTFVVLFNLVQTSFNTVWAPKSVEHYERFPEDKKFYNIAFKAMVVIMFFIGITLILFKNLFVLLLGAKFREAAYIMPFLIFSPIMYTISETTVVGINFSKKSHLHVIVAVGSCLTNLVGNTILVPVMGCKGAAISTGVSYIVFFALRTFLSERNYSVGFDLKRLCLITLIVIGYATYNTFVEFNILCIVFALICYLVLFVCYYETIKWLWKYLKQSVFPIVKRA